MKNKGQFKHRQVKETAFQLKKHVEQMADKEIKTIVQRVKELSRLKLSNHVEKKVKYDGLYFQPAAIVAVLKNMGRHNIIEYNANYTEDGTEARVLFRSEEVYLVEVNEQEVECNLCFVLSLDKNEITTVYWNKDTDNHNKVNWSRYTASLKVI